MQTEQTQQQKKRILQKKVENTKNEFIQKPKIKKCTKPKKTTTEKHKKE